MARVSERASKGRLTGKKMVRGAKPIAPSKATMSLKKGSSSATICTHNPYHLKTKYAIFCAS